jgi:AcrR family transcriptional regulator
VGAVKKQSPLRAEQAALTRRRILDAAASSFETLGFAGTRVEDVAAGAGVAVPTVYKGFVNKRNLLLGALELAMTGEVDGDPVDQQAWFTEQLAEPDPVRQLQLIARNARRISERAGPLLRVLRSAAPLDPVLGSAWDDIATQRLARSRRTARNLMGKAAGRVDLPREEVALTLCTLTEPDLFLAYTSVGRTSDQYERWLGEILCRSLLT